MAAKLKVFITSDGLTDYVVATSSRPKALAAWGSHQDLFKSGLAHETDDPELAEAARARPGEVLRRAAGSRAALEKLQPVKRPKPEKPAGPSKAQLRKVARLQSELEAAGAAHAKAIAELDARRQALDVAYARERKRLEAALTEARRAQA